MTLSISDSLAADLRDYLLSTLPTGLPLTADTILPRIATADLPGVRLTILTGEARMTPGMSGTGTVLVELEYATPIDSVTPSTHLAQAGLLATWWRALRPAKRRGIISTRCYLHDLTPDQAPPEVRQEEREQITAFKGEALVTLLSE